MTAQNRAAVIVMGPLGFVPQRKEHGLYLFVFSRAIPLFSFLGLLQKRARSLAGDEKHESRRKTIQMSVVRQSKELQRKNRKSTLHPLRQLTNPQKRTRKMDVRQHLKTTLLLLRMWKEILSEVSQLSETSLFLCSRNFLGLCKEDRF